MGMTRLVLREVGTSLAFVGLRLHPRVVALGVWLVARTYR